MAPEPKGRPPRGQGLADRLLPASAAPWASRCPSFPSRCGYRPRAPTEASSTVRSRLTAMSRWVPASLALGWEASERPYQLPPPRRGSALGRERTHIWGYRWGWVVALCLRWAQCGSSWRRPGRAGKGKGGARGPHPPQCVLPLQILGFFKGMSFPIASIAVVNSVLFGVYSNALLALTATSHHERRLQPPSYTHVFIAGCTGGFLQVRAAGACAHAHTHTHTRGQRWAVRSCPSHPHLLTHSCRPWLSPRNVRGGGEMAAPAAPSGLAWLSGPSTLQAWRAGAEQRGPKQRELRGVGGGDGAERTP